MYLSTFRRTGLEPEPLARKAHGDCSQAPATESRNGQVKPVGNTVDLDSATYTNDIGSVSLSTLWHDPDFDPSQRAFYYTRLLEIPTPSWQTFDRKVFGDDMPDHVDKIVQDRAYTSPIWYSPNP